MKIPRRISLALPWTGFILLLTFALIKNGGVLHGEVTSGKSIGVSSGQTTSAGPTFFNAPFYHGGAVTLPIFGDASLGIMTPTDECHVHLAWVFNERSRTS
jgi:hypothetical protein